MAPHMGLHAELQGYCKGGGCLLCPLRLHRTRFPGAKSQQVNVSSTCTPLTVSSHPYIITWEGWLEKLNWCLNFCNYIIKMQDLIYDFTSYCMHTHTRMHACAHTHITLFPVPGFGQTGSAAQQFRKPHSHKTNKTSTSVAFLFLPLSKSSLFLLVYSV